MGAKPRARQRDELAVKPAARPQPPVDVYSKVKRYAFSQIRKMKRSGYALKRGTWSNENLRQACAVGAIAFNGDQPTAGASFDECFVVASPALRGLGVRAADMHTVLMSISNGFEFGSDGAYALLWPVMVPLSIIVAPVLFLGFKATEVGAFTARKTKDALEAAAKRREQRQETRAADGKLPRAVAKERK